VKKWHGMSSRLVMYDNVTCVSPASLALRAILRRFASRRVVTCTTLHSNVPQHLLPHKSVRIPATAKLFKLLAKKAAMALGLLSLVLVTANKGCQNMGLLSVRFQAVQETSSEGQQTET
jgi:hypothetical protein